MLKYSLRYLPLLLALLLIPLRLTDWGQRNPNPVPVYQALSPFRPGSALYGITMLSRDDGWAVGGFFTRACSSQGPQDKTSCPITPYSGLILHYTSKTWEPAKVSRNITLPLLAVSLDSPSDGWAVGYNATLVHYNGDSWSTVPGPANFNKNLFGVSMLTPADGWAVGYGGSILHYDGKQWTQIASPTQFDLRSIAMSSSQEGWAVGDNGTILHYHAGIWSVASSPTRNALNSVALLSSHEGWAVGKQDTILHYRDETGVWEQVDCGPNSCQGKDLYGIAMSTITSGWAIGDQHLLAYRAEVWSAPNNIRSSSANPPAAKFNFPDLNLYAVALPSPAEGWAVGRTTAGNGDNVFVILHYQNNGWSSFFTGN